MGLQLLNRSVTQEECRAACCNDPGCEEWVYASKRSIDPAGATTMSCSTGRGFECESIRTDIIPHAGQRITHGTRLPPGVWCTGNGMQLAQLDQRMSHKERIDSCRSTCFFNTDCHVWQYSTLKGCWFGRSHQCFKDVSLAGTIMDSQKFVCDAMAGPEKTNYLMVFLVILSAAVLLLCFAIIVLFFGLCGPKRPQSRPQTPRSPKSSRPWQQESFDDEDGSQELDQRPEDISPAHGGLYQPIHHNSSPISSNPSSTSMSETGSMVPLVPGQAGVPGGAPQIRPMDTSFGASSSNSSFSGTAAPLLGQPHPRMQPMVQQGTAFSPMGSVDPRSAGLAQLHR